MEKRFSFLFITLCLLLPAQQQSRAQDDDEIHEDPAARDRWRVQMRANENGEIPFGALLKARQQMDRLREANPPRMDAGVGNWEWLGPGNIGGRIRAILIHPTVPSVMWIGSVSGGIWRTNDGGGNWFPMTDFMANLAVTSLAMDPTNSNVMYASTGEGFGDVDGRLQGAGIFKSSDGGYTWNQLPFTNNPNFFWATRLAHDPTYTNVLLATTANGNFSNSPGSVWRTTDGGVLWNTVLNTPARALDVKCNPGLGIQVMVGTASDLYYSSDGGITWTRETTGAAGKLPLDAGRCEVAFGQNGIMYASLSRNNGEVWRSGNAGLTWSLRNTGTNYLSQGGYANTIWVSPVNQNLVVVGGLDLWKSTDGGSTLIRISDWHNFHNGGPANSAHADQHIILQHPGFNGTSNATVFFGNDGGIQRAGNILTVDTTSGWTNLANNLGITQFYGGAAAPDGSIIVGGTRDNDKLHYTPANGINNWRQPVTGDGGFTAIDFEDPSRIYGEYIYLGFKRSDNGGLSYADKVNGLQDAGNSSLASYIAPFSMAPGFPAILVAGGRRIWRTVDRGDTWFQIRDSLPFGTPCTAIDIGSSAPNIVWVGYQNGSVARTTNGGLNWTNVNNGLPFTTVTDIAINPTNTNEVFVTFGSYAPGMVYLTTNNGANWIQRSGNGSNAIPAIQVNTIRYHPTNNNWVYVGTDLGVLASEDKGLTWNVTPRFAGTDGPVNVEVDELFWQGTEYLIAATHGRGMFRARILQTVYVDINNNGFENGTLQFPYNTVQEGTNAAGNGSDISIKTGTYPHAPVAFSRRGLVLLRDGMVEIRGATSKPAAIPAKKGKQ